jgi:hypothetical protein
MITMVAADTVTALHHSPYKTMRGMPYPQWMSEPQRRIVHFYYAVSQVFATCRVMFANPASAMTLLTEHLLILFPIQLAPFLMTLNKKGIITCTAWHVWYGVALGLNYVYHTHLLLRYGISSEYQSLAVAVVFCYLRFRRGINKYVLWTLLPAMALYVLWIDQIRIRPLR